MSMAVHRNQPMSEALKNAELLFETKSINEIREIEGKTKRDIDEKKRQLRRLVGDSYRDLIESADKIVAIANTCNTILSNVTHVQDAFSQLKNNITSASRAGDKKESLRKHEELYAVGSRIKYLVDTPEMIWGCLDSHDYLEAAWRYLRAHEVYNLLQTNFSPDMLARFPLRNHQWPQVQKFKQQILTAVKASLTSSSERSSAQVADALAAAAVLQGLDSGATLQLYLSSRQTLMTGVLAAQAGGNTDVEQVGGLLVGWANALQQSITQVAELFLDGSGEGGSSLLLQVLTKTDQSESSGLFYTPPASTGAGDGSPTHASQESVTPEASAWLTRLRSFQDLLLPQPSGQVEKACRSWVAGLAQQLLAACKELLGSCKEAATLCKVEQAVRSAIAAWAKPDDKKQQLQGNWVAASPGGSGRGPGQDSWSQVCERVLGQRFDAWQELFHEPVLARAKEIVADSFLSVGRSVEAPVESCLAEAAAAAPEPAGRVHCESWPQYSPVSEALAAGSGRLGSMSSGQMLLQALPESDFNLTPQTPTFRQQVHQIRQQFDTHLHATLASCLDLLEAPLATSSPPTMNSAYSAAMSGLLLRQASSLTAGGLSNNPTGRAAELEPFIQQQCVAMANSVSTFLQAKFDALPPATPTSPSSATTVEQALLIGRLARAFSSDSSGLQLVLGPPELWRPQNSATLPSHQMSHRGGSKAPQQGIKYKALLPVFVSISHAAYRLWAQWAAACLSQQLQSLTQHDEVLRMSVVPVSWSQTVLGGGGDPEGLEDAGEMRFSLPACPSSEAFGFLDAACQETRRAGGNLLGTEALQVLEWELLGGAIKAYESLLEEGTTFSQAVTERGVLQLLFDLRFIRDVLAGGRPLPSPQPQAPELPDPSISAAVAERRRQGTALEASLQSRLDPIDWATYEPYLWANVEKYYHRCSVLLGTLVQLQRTYSEAAGKLQPSHELNPLDLLPVVSRFQYLPISAPTHNLHASQARSGAASASKLSVSSESPSLDESYSFTNLGKTVRGGGLTSSSASTGESSSADGSLTASTLGALQAKLQVGSLGTFGTLLGDKAAEMTAMAQQRFGDIGLADISSGLTSGLLSSFAKGVGSRTTVPGK